MSLYADNGGMGGEYAYRMGGVPITLIASGVARKRPLNSKAVQKLKDSIMAQGQVLQHIGLRATRGLDGGPYELVYGAHRVQAIKELFEEGKREANSVPAIIYTSNTPEWFIEMAEISENLVRNPLTEREAGKQTGELVQIIAEKKNLAVGRKHGGMTGNRSKSKSPELHHATQDKQPTAIDTASKMIGKSTQTITRRIRSIAKDAGVEDINLEEITPKQLGEIIKKADENKERIAEAKAAARKEEIKTRAVTRNIPSKVLDEDDGYDIEDVEMSEAIDEVLTLFKTLEKRHGEGVIKEAINRWWKAKHPNGRVPFQINPENR
jgi:hypothetical protein